MEEKQEEQTSQRPSTLNADERLSVPDAMMSQSKEVTTKPPTPESKDITPAAEVEDIHPVAESKETHVNDEIAQAPFFKDTSRLSLTGNKSQTSAQKKSSQTFVTEGRSQTALQKQRSKTYPTEGISQTFVTEEKSQTAFSKQRSKTSPTEGISQTFETEETSKTPQAETERPSAVSREWTPTAEGSLTVVGTPLDDTGEVTFESSPVIDNKSGSLIRVKQPSSTDEDPDYRITEVLFQSKLSIQVLSQSVSVTEAELDVKDKKLESQIETQPKITAVASGKKGQNIYPCKIDRIRPAEVIYKAAARVIQDPTKPVNLRSCYRDYIAGSSVRGAKGGSNRQVAEMIRRDLQGYRYACKRQWEPNPACTVPMRVRLYGRRSRVKSKPTVEEWRIFEERDKEKRDHELAKKLGYETLVGNLLYIDIPGAKDINRSWQNFLSPDEMEWGFPYEKGSIDRPRMKQPEPYLAHQVKEKLWKFPRSRTFQTAPEE